MALNNADSYKGKAAVKANYIDLARFVGIYAVVLGHFAPYTGCSNEIGRELLYMFHVPLFFIISGMLSKPSSVLRVFYALIVPYLLYNVISIVKMDFRELLTFNALELNNSPTWFFPALFFIKLLADFIRRGIPFYIGAIILAVILLHLFDIPIPRLFGLHAVIYGIPFFLFGKYIKDKMSSILSVSVGWLSLCIVALLCVFIFYERFDLYSSELHNPIVYFVSSCLASLFVLVICHRLFDYIPQKWLRFIVTNSRGTMFILGTHYIALGVLNKYILGGISLTFGLKILIVCLSSIPYYYLIRYTYDKFPILYGKMKQHPTVYQ